MVLPPPPEKQLQASHCAGEPAPEARVGVVPAHHHLGPGSGNDEGT